MRAGIAILFLLLTTSACMAPYVAPETSHECIASYGVDSGYDHESDAPGCWGATSAGCDAPTADAVVADAANDGVTVTVDELVTREAALCIAEGLGLADGLEGFQALLRYDQGHHTPTWTVRNLLQQGDTFAAGDYVLLDAIGGGVIESGEWLE